MRIVVAPDSFKGSLSALGAAEAMARGIRVVFPEAEVILAPIADGGEGTVEALVAATGGRLLHTEVRGPLGEPVLATWGCSGDGTTAFLETAAASGRTLVPEGLSTHRQCIFADTGRIQLVHLGFGRLKRNIRCGKNALQAPHYAFVQVVQHSSVQKFL